MGNAALYRRWANLLEGYGCQQLARGLRGGQSIGLQQVYVSSLNGKDVENAYGQGLEKLVSAGLAGGGIEQAQRTVDTVLDGLVAQHERSVLAYLLDAGMIQDS